MGNCMMNQLGFDQIFSVRLKLHHPDSAIGGIGDFLKFFDRPMKPTHQKQSHHHPVRDQYDVFRELGFIKVAVERF